MSGKLMVCHYCDRMAVSNNFLNSYPLCNTCYEEVNNQYRLQCDRVTDLFSIIMNSSEIDYILGKLKAVLTDLTELRKNIYFSNRVMGEEIENLRHHALRDFSVYQVARNEKRTELRHEEYDKLHFVNRRKEPKCDFIAIDIETTGLRKDVHEIIEIAAVKFFNGKEIETFTSFVKPTKSIPAKITEINGITNADVKSAEPIDKVIVKFIDFIGDSPLVAHNAPFDIGFLRFQSNEVKHKLKNKVIDTLSIAKKQLNYIIAEGYSYKLGDLCSYIGYRAKKTHRAYDDALAAAHLYTYLKNTFVIDDLETKAKNRNIKTTEIISTKTDFDESHPLFGKTIVFTGNLQALERKEAMQKVVDVGGVIRQSVSSKTDYLVVGIQDPSIVGENGLSAKEVKAYELIKKGQKLNIINEHGFIHLINQGVPSV